MSQPPHPFEGDEARWDRVGELYEQALARPPSERAAFLDHACDDDGEVRAEVESLLRADAEASSRFSLLGAVARSALADLGPDTLPAPGTRIGPYTIGETLGQGGMGAVVRAFDERLERPVALKFLRTAGDAHARERLLREARAVAALDHRHICAIHAIEAEGHQPFLVLALYEGETLRDRLRRGPLSLADALAVAEQTTSALEAAHAAGVAHRDLKPANVFLVAPPRAHAPSAPIDVRLLDFGIARRDQAVSITRTGTSVGTPGYMAPEQVRGEAAGPAADLWALGVLLCEMVTGSRPFASDSDVAEVYGVLEREPPLLAEVPGVPEGLCTLVAWLLEKRPDRRPASASIVRDALHTLQTGAGAVARPPPRRRGTVPAKLARLAFVGLALVAALALVALWLVRPSPPPAEASSVVVMPFTVRGGPELAYLREGLVDLLSTGLDDVGGLRAADPNAVLGRAGDTPPTLGEARRMAERFGAGHFVLGRVTDTGSGFRLDASLYRADGVEEARAQADVSSPDALLPALDALARQIVAGRLDDDGQALAGLAARTTGSSRALRAYLEGEQAMRLTEFAAAQDAFSDAVAADSSFALAWYRLARATGWTGNTVLNLRATSRAVALADALPPRTRATLAGYHAFRTGQPDRAERAYRDALARAPDDAETWQLLGELLFHYNPYRGRSVEEARQPLEMARSYAPDNRELLPHLIELAARRGDGAAVDSLVPLYAGEARTADPYAALHAWTTGGDEGRTVALERFRQLGPEGAESALLHIVPAVQDLELTRALGMLVSTLPARAATGSLTLALLSAREQRWPDAARHFDAARAVAPDDALVHFALVAAQPDVPRTMTARARRDIAVWRPRSDSLALPIPASSQKRFLLGLLDLRLGLPDAARAAADTLVLGRPLERDLARTLRAALSIEADQPRQALEALHPMESDLPFSTRRSSALVGGAYARMLRARALEQLGQPESARWQTSLYDGDAPWGLGFRPF